MAVIRALGTQGIEVIGADDRKLPFNLHSRYAKRNYVYPRTEKDGFIEALIGMMEREKPDVLLPLGGTNLVCKHLSAIEKYTNLIVPAFESFKVAFDNQRALEALGPLGIACPQVLNDEEAIDELRRNERRANPVSIVIKPRQDFGGGSGVFFVKNIDEFTKSKLKVEREFGKSVVQEYIPGDTASMRTVNLLFDRQSRLAAYFTSRKIRQWPESGGISALSISTHEWGLVELVLPFFSKWRWQGPAEVELKIDTRDNQPKLIEINPRFWGYVGFPIRCGVNFPLIASKLALGENIAEGACPKYPAGIKYVNPTAFLKAVGHDIRTSPNKAQAIHRALADLKGKKVTNNLKLTDPLSIVGKILQELKSSEISHHWVMPEE
jgi:predicted ATP-grasp superfamily ATP-dependent carboligase